MNILISEDSKSFNNFLKQSLEKEYNIFQAYTLSEAKKILNEENIDVILLDLFLPDGNSAKLLDNIDTKKTKVIVLTSYENKNLKETLYKKGITNYIYKTLDYNLLIDEIKKNLEFIQKHSHQNIYIIDKDRTIFYEIQAYLKGRGYNFIFKTCCKEIREDADLVIVNISYVNPNTLYFIKKQLTYIPIIGLFKKFNYDKYISFKKMGVNEFISHPFNTEELILKIDNLLTYYEHFKKLNNDVKELKKKLKKEMEKNIKKENFLRSQARKAQIGDMLALIAHQLKQPINHISLSNFFIKEYINGNETKENAIESTQQIDVSVEYISSTIDTFKNFFKPKKREKSSLKKIIDKTIIILKPLIEINNVNVEIIVKKDEKIKIFENDLIQVLINIMKNAIEALVSNKIENPKITIIIEKKKIIIKDNAGGIPNKILKKLFKPYTSTKGDEGTGLGLYMCKKIVEDVFKGDIKAYNDNDGAVFEITL